jgi:hypothetical protein
VALIEASIETPIFLSPSRLSTVLFKSYPFLSSLYISSSISTTTISPIALFNANMNIIRGFTDLTLAPAPKSSAHHVNIIKPQIAQDIFTANTVAVISTVGEVNFIIISATCAGIDQSTQIRQPFSLLNPTILNNGNLQQVMQFDCSGGNGWYGKETSN